MKVATYIRVSTDNIEQKESIDNQLIQLRQVVPGAVEYVDEGYTGTNNNRPGFIKMLYNCGLRYNDQFSIFYVDKTLPVIHKDIYCTHSSRFSRDTSVIDIFTKLASQGVTIHFTQEGKDTSNLNNSTETFVLHLQTLLNNVTSLETSAKVKKGMEASSSKGRVLTPSTIYGYKLKDNRLYAIEEQAEVVREIYTMYIEGLGYKKIANYLNSNNIKTKQGKTWCSEAIRSILSNPKYYGCNRRNFQSKSKLNRDTSYKLKPQSEWYEFEYGQEYNGIVYDRIEPIVSKDTWLKVQSIRDNKQTGRRGSVRHDTPLSTKIKCQLCGKNYVFNSYPTKKGNVGYYVCTVKKFSGVKVCNNKNLYVKTIEALVNTDYINGLIFRNRQLRLQGINRQIRELEDSINSNTDEVLNEYKTTLSRLQSRKSVLLDRLLDNTIDNNTFQLKAKELDEEIESTTRLIDDINNGSSINKARLYELKQMKAKVLNISISNDYSFSKICNMINSITVNQNKLLLDISVNGIQFTDELYY